MDLKPSTIALLPLLAADHFDKPANELAVNSVSLSAPDVDLYTWRDRSKKAGTAQTEKYKWPPRNACLGPVDEDESTNRRSERSFGKGNPRPAHLTIGNSHPFFATPLINLVVRFYR